MHEHLHSFWPVVERKTPKSAKRKELKLKGKGDA